MEQLINGNKNGHVANEELGFSFKLQKHIIR